MKKIEIIVRPEVVDHLQDELFAHGVRGMTVSPVQGAGNQRGFTEFYRGTEVLVQMRPKAKLEVVVADDDRIDDIVDIVFRVARSGEIGDGKIFILPVEEAIRIRTGERGTDAL